MLASPPDLSSAPTQDLIALRGLLTKYDESEPRDEAGKWTADGGVSYSPGLTALDQSLVAPAKTEIGDLMRQFPWAPLTAVRQADDMAPWTVAATNQAGNTIGLNTWQWSPGGRYMPLDNVATPGWYAAGGQPEAIVAHEFGHVVQAYLDAQKADGTAVGRAYDAWWNSSRIASAHELSGYARTGNSHEAFAEMFAATYGPPNPNAESDDPVGFDAFMRSQGLGPKVGKIVKYSEDQPRDDHGRWTSDGGGLAERANPLFNFGATGLMGDPTSIQVPAAWHGDLATALKDLSARYPNTVFDPSLLKGVPGPTLQALAALDRMLTQFPGVEMAKIDMATLGKNIMANTDQTKGNSIQLGARFFGPNSPGWGGMSAGWGVKGTENPAGTVIHEFGHAVFGQLVTNAGGNTTVAAVPDAPMETFINVMQDLPLHQEQEEAGSLSHYALVGGPLETIAEAFNAAFNPDSQEREHPFAVAVSQLVAAEPRLTTAKEVVDPWGPGGKRLGYPIDEGGHRIKLEKASPLSFIDRAKKILRQGYVDAYTAGFDDVSDPPDPLDPAIDPYGEDVAINELDLTDTELDSDELNSIVDGKTTEMGDLLAGLAALIFAGGISAAMEDARLGQYASTLNSLYEYGFEAGVTDQGDVVTATWHTVGDEATCDLCHERDDQTWLRTDEHPFPGEGSYGEVCEGGPNCRCEIWYDVLPLESLAESGALGTLSPDAQDLFDESVLSDDADDLIDETGGSLSGLIAPPTHPSTRPQAGGLQSSARKLRVISTATLLAVRHALKYSEDELRDAAGRWTTTGQDYPIKQVSDALVAGGSLPSGTAAHDARVLMEALNSAPRQPVLYRGLQLEAVPRKGELFQEPLGSWTSTLGNAEGYAEAPAGRAIYGAATEGQQVVLIAHDAKGLPQAEEEFISGGIYSVDSVRREGGVAYVTVNQARTYDASTYGVLKYSPDQPRDDHGRWEAGVDPGTDKATFERAVERWTNFSSEQIRAAAAGLGEGKYSGSGLRGAKEVQAWAQALATRVASGSRAPELWRGVAGVTHDGARTVTMNLSSWSTDRATAEAAARGGLIYRLEPGATGLNIAAESHVPTEHEWVTDGRFDVTSVHGNVVSLTQTEVFQPPTWNASVSWGRSPEIDPQKYEDQYRNPFKGSPFEGTKAESPDLTKYDDSEPRDDAGRWTAGGAMPEPWRAGPYASKTELVPVSTMNRIRAGNPLGKTDVPALAEDIRRNGFREPLIVTYHTSSRTAVLDEGNHRLEAARRLGLTEVPVRVVRATSGEGTPVPGKAPDEFGYVPGDLKPSDIGLGTTFKFDENEPRDQHGRWTSADTGETFGKLEAAWQRVSTEIQAQGVGNCYEAANTLLLNAASLGLQNPTVIQATCVGQGPIAGMPFGHSWLEADGPEGHRLAYDYSSGHQTMLPADYYRQLGQATDIHEYSRLEALRWMADTGHYGPWEYNPPNTGPGVPKK